MPHETWTPDPIDDDDSKVEEEETGIATEGQDGLEHKKDPNVND